MNKSLSELIARGRKVQMGSAEREKQRRSFAFGTTKIENERITRELVEAIAEEEEKGGGDRGKQ